MTNKASAPDSSEMLNKIIDEIARDIGEMNPDDSTRAQRLQEVCALSQVRKSLSEERDKMFHRRINALAREILTGPKGHPGRAIIVSEILRLSEPISK